MATYTADAIPAGTYAVQVCPFDGTVRGRSGSTPSRSPPATPRPRPATRRAAATRAGATSPPTRRSTRPTETPDQLRRRLLDRPGRGLRHPARRARATSRPSARGTPSRPAWRRSTTVGNNANTHEAWASPLTPGGTAQAPVSPTRDYTAEFTDAWNNSRLRPRPAHARRQRHRRLGRQPLRRAQPDARLHLLPRLHRGQLQPAADNGGRGGVAGDPEVGNAQAGAITGGSPTVPRARQRQPDHPAGRHPRHHQPVPLPADRRRVLRPLHRRRPRHGHRRPRVHPRHQQPDGRRPRRGPDLRAGRRDGRVVGRPGRRASTSSSTATATAATSGPSAPTPPATSTPPSATTPSTTTRSTTPTTASTPPAPRCTPTARSGTARSGRSARPSSTKYDASFAYDDRALQLRCAQATRDREPDRGRGLPGQPALAPADVRLVPAPAGRDLDAGRPRRDDRRRPDALRRRRRRTCCGAAFARRGMGVDASVAAADDDEPDAELRGPDRPTPPSRSRPAARRRSTSATTRPASPRSPTPTPVTPLGATAVVHPRRPTTCSPSPPTAASPASPSPSPRAVAPARCRWPTTLNLASTGRGRDRDRRDRGLAQPRGPDRRHRGHQLGRRHRGQRRRHAPLGRRRPRRRRADRPPGAASAPT